MMTTQDPELWFDPGKCLIAGQWVAPAGGGSLPLENPSTGAVIGASVSSALVFAAGRRRGVVDPLGLLSTRRGMNLNG
jgi:hypothetical protein